MMDTFEERQAHIEKCQLEMLEAQAKAARSQALCEEASALLQGFWAHYNAEMSMLIYRGMFDPNFCKPADLKGRENTMDKLKIYVDPPPAPRMPRLGLDRPNYHWRHLMWLCLACAAVSGVVWLVLR